MRTMFPLLSTLISPALATSLPASMLEWWRGLILVGHFPFHHLYLLVHGVLVRGVRRRDLARLIHDLHLALVEFAGFRIDDVVPLDVGQRSDRHRAARPVPAGFRAGRG